MNTNSSAVCVISTKGGGVFLLTSWRGLALRLQGKCGTQFSWPASFEMIRFLKHFESWDTLFWIVLKMRFHWDPFVTRIKRWTIRFHLKCYHPFRKGLLLAKVFSCLWGANTTWEQLVGVKDWKGAEGELSHLEPQSASFPAVVLQSRGVISTLGHLLWNS